LGCVPEQVTRSSRRARVPEGERNQPNPPGPWLIHPTWARLDPATAGHTATRTTPNPPRPRMSRVGRLALGPPGRQAAGEPMTTRAPPTATASPPQRHVRLNQADLRCLRSRAVVGHSAPRIGGSRGPGRVRPSRDGARGPRSTPPGALPVVKRRPRVLGVRRPPGVLGFIGHPRWVARRAAAKRSAEFEAAFARMSTRSSTRRRSRQGGPGRAARADVRSRRWSAPVISIRASRGTGSV
jgi:hypothetical protein